MFNTARTGLKIASALGALVNLQAEVLNLADKLLGERALGAGNQDRTRSDPGIEDDLPLRENATSRSI
jgi:hypothetical protein